MYIYIYIYFVFIIFIFYFLKGLEKANKSRKLEGRRKDARMARGFTSRIGLGESGPVNGPARDKA